MTRFKATEASVVAVFYSLFAACSCTANSRSRGLLPVFRKSVIVSAAMMFIIANAGLFAFIITRAGVPEAIGTWLSAALDSPK